ncbi:MAG: hypothetical protein ACOYVF_03785 [Candidatus Zixiibacteriota bacterium]
MSNHDRQIKTLVGLHTFLWYLLIGWFALTAGLYLLQVAAAGFFSETGVILTVAVTILRLTVMSEQFRKADNRRFQLINYLLISIILITILFKRFL